MSIALHTGDLPDTISFGAAVAIDTETMGLNPKRDRLCLVQLSAGDGTAHIVQFEKDHYNAPNLVRLLQDQSVQKIFHFARFDVAVLKEYLKTDTKNVFCTKIASRLCRTYTDKHGLKDLVQELLDVKLDKQQQSSNWGAEKLTQEQMIYAASDVLYLHKVKDRLEQLLEKNGRKALAQGCFDFINIRGQLDLAGWAEIDIFAHS